MKNLHKTLLLALLVATASGCASARRSVTHVRIEKDKAYLAYAEWDEGAFTSITGTNDRSRVKRCTINPDNSLTCEEDADINYILNPQEDGPPPPAAKKKAPSEPAPAEEAPAAEPEAEGDEAAAS